MSTPLPTPNRRLQRVDEQVRRELSEIIRREFNVEKTGLLTVNEIRTAPDLKTATVFIGFVGTNHQKHDLPEKLKTAAPHIQILLGRALRLKWTPVLAFVLDESVERGNRVLAILEELGPVTPATAPTPAPTPAPKSGPDAPASPTPPTAA
jgi:ribosome-binding factor A